MTLGYENSEKRIEGAGIQFRDEQMEGGANDCKVIACLVHLRELSSSSKPFIRQTVPVHSK